MLPFSPLVEHAIELSAQWHDRTYRKGGWREPAFDPVDSEFIPVPVSAHVTAVAICVARAGWDEATIAAAFLHDALEDEDRHGRRLARLRLEEAVGKRVVELVEFVTEQKLDSEGQHRSWRVRKEDYLRRLRKAPIESIAISTADKLHNLWSINQALRRGIDVFAASSGRRPLSAGPAEQIWFHAAVFQLAQERGDPRLEGMLQQLQHELATLSELVQRP